MTVRVTNCHFYLLSAGRSYPSFSISADLNITSAYPGFLGLLPSGGGFFGCGLITGGSFFGGGCGFFWSSPLWAATAKARKTTIRNVNNICRKTFIAIVLPLSLNSRLRGKRESASALFYCNPSAIDQGLIDQPAIWLDRYFRAFRFVYKSLRFPLFLYENVNLSKFDPVILTKNRHRMPEL